MLKLPLLETLPFQFGDFFDSPLHVLILFHGPADSLVPSLGDTELARLSLVTLHQVQGLMQCALGAPATGIAALTGAFRQVAAQKPSTRCPLRDAGAQVALGGGEFCADGCVHPSLNIYDIQVSSRKLALNSNQKMPGYQKSLLPAQNQRAGRGGNLGCGT